MTHIVLYLTGCQLISLFIQQRAFNWANSMLSNILWLILRRPYYFILHIVEW